MAEDLNDSAIEAGQTTPGVLVSDYYKQSYGYEVRRSGGTKDWLLTYTQSGCGMFSIDGQEVICKQGHFVILKPGTAHHYMTMEGQEWEFFLVHFLPKPDWIRWLQLPEPLKGMIHFQIEDPSLLERLTTAFQRVLFESRAIGAYKEELSSNAMEEILLLLAQKHRQAAQSLDPRIEVVLQMITHQLQESYTIKDLANKVNLSPSRLAHLFKEQVGDSIIGARNKIRLRHAARLLEFTTRSIAEIAEDVGFFNPFYFTKQFTAFFGQSPTAFRAQIRSRHEGEGELTTGKKMEN